jgi:hypothetical protein
MEELEPEKVDFGFYFKTKRVLFSQPIIDFKVEKEAHLVFDFLIDDYGNVTDVKFKWKESTDFCLLVFELEKYLSKVMFKPLYHSIEELPEPTLNYYTKNDYLYDVVKELDVAQFVFESFVDSFL